ncbi:putative Polycomb group protein ASXL2 isoform X2 [Dunckerocampus dactyliophorus]|uniref:putative Polycomb group protein ASXL2 isoform X2 n=1 Tax=Dunckerocampus dactyliophorus TaxID=161453 RepID=UPI0024055933|nr:putative Polycomb group protein ASXL2 isoform X2 [Dunckerocampus dactyliophorus]
MREKQKKKKGRTWAEAAKTVLEKYPNTPMSHKEILQVIQRERLKEISGTSPLACLNAMLHTNSRGEEGMFYKVPGRMGVYTLKDISDVAKELTEEGSDDSSDNLSDSRSTENSNNSAYREGQRRKWMRGVPSKLQSQPPSSPPQPRCSSPSVPAAKLISPSQKHSKKALKQALKQQQQRNQRRQGVMPTTSSSRLLLKTIKDMADNITAKTDLCLPVVPRKASQRSSRLSAGHLKRNKCKIDVETPDSILVNTNLRAIINKHTFSVLPPDCQQKLLRLLPEVDQQACVDGLLKVTSSALNNEFFTSAAQAWKERLAEGEFTPELQLRMRQEIEKEKKVEHWKEAFFESYYGENSGLSFEESKELTKVDLKWETEPVVAVKASEEMKAAKNRNRTDGVPPKSTPAPAQTQLPKPSLPILEPMKTRRSQYTEDRKMHAALQSAPTYASPPPVPEKQNEHVPAATRTEQSQKDNKPDLPRSPARTSPLLEVKENEPGSAVKPPEEMKPEPDGTPEEQKRKSPGVREDEVMPEKRPRLSSVSSVASSVSSVSPPVSSIPSPATPTSTGKPRVPPLKIPVSRILPVPVSPSHGEPRTPLPSPARTGARTLADIKAKAQLARAQRAAAAAASKEPIPLPSPSLSPTSPQASARLAAPSCPQDPFGPLSPSPWKQDSSCVSTASVQPQKPAPSVHSTKCQDNLSGSIRTTSCIPANNPLVTRLLQGKEVPLEQILPKPLTKMDVKMANIHASKMKMSYSGVDGRGPEHQQHGTQSFSLSDHPRHHREPPDKDTQEQILQTLMERKVQQRQAPQSLHCKAHQATHGEEHLNRPWISVGFLARKRTPRPAMSGHYLLNVSTYGRGSESKRCHQSVIPNVCAVKRESADGEAQEETLQQGVSGTKSEDAEGILLRSDIKTEPGLEDSATGTESNSSYNRKQLELCSSNRGRSEPYLLLKDAGHLRQKKSVHQEPAAPHYGGTISMSIPHALNHSSLGAAASSAPSSSDAGSVMSFSVTVTTIPAGNSLDHAVQSQTSHEPAFMEGADMEDSMQSKCYCRLKAMIMCKGCGAFCHHDCIGPSELCVSCLVVR